MSRNLAPGPVGTGARVHAGVYGYGSVLGLHSLPVGELALVRLELPHGVDEAPSPNDLYFPPSALIVMPAGLDRMHFSQGGRA